MRKQWTVIAVISAAVLAPTCAVAWGPGGHMMVAQIAFSRLSPKAKNEVVRLLKISIAPAQTTVKSRDFVGAAHWADDIRSDPQFDTTEFKARHFIDQPFSKDGTALPGDLPEANNIVAALEKYVTVLRDKSAKDGDRAQALRFVIHFVGDIQQPLHCATLVAKGHPEGDNGGNGFMVKAPGKGSVKLHSYWDGGLATFPAGKGLIPPTKDAVATAAAAISKSFPDSDAGWKNGGVAGYAAWCKESLDLARSKAYDDLKPNGNVSAGYIKAGVAVAQKRVAWGGYRLAALLNDIFK